MPAGGLAVGLQGPRGRLTAAALRLGPIGLHILGPIPQPLLPALPTTCTPSEAPRIGLGDRRPSKRPSARDLHAATPEVVQGTLVLSLTPVQDPGMPQLARNPAPVVLRAGHWGPNGGFTGSTKVAHSSALPVVPARPAPRFFKGRTAFALTPRGLSSQALLGSLKGNTHLRSRAPRGPRGGPHKGRSGLGYRPPEVSFCMHRPIYFDLLAGLAQMAAKGQGV